MKTIIIFIILIIIVILAVRSSYKHLKGQGSCCGGGNSEKPKKKKLDGDRVAEKVISIEGMHCDHCKNSVEGSINKIEGAVAKVNLKKNIAVVSMDREISDEELIAAVESVDFKVTGITRL